MLLLLALGIGTLAGCGTWLLLRERSFDTVLGLTLLSYAVNLFIFAIGRLKTQAVPIVGPGASPSLATLADPLPQALVLTAIVIGFAMTAVAIVLALRAHGQLGSDRIDADPGHDGSGA